MSKRWTVRKGGSATGGYTKGWFAMSADGEQGAYLPTFQEAIELATTRADEQHARELTKQRGLTLVTHPAPRPARPEWSDVAAWNDKNAEACS